MIVVMTSKTITVYGIANCHTVKKARAWLSAHGVEYEFHDFKKLGVPETQLNNWLQQVGWEKLINRKGTTWRGLEASTQASVVNDANAKRVILSNTSVIKRPVVSWGGSRVTVGFDAQMWASFAMKYHL